MATTQQLKTETLIDWTIKGASFIMSIAIMISSFFLTKAWEKISNLEKDIIELKIESGKVQSNRFSSNDWVNAKTILDTERLAMDRRIIRIEETYPTISESISEIRQSIRKIEDEHHSQ